VLRFECKRANGTGVLALFDSTTSYRLHGVQPLTSIQQMAGIIRGAARGKHSQACFS
jgi:hypothetical protein